MQKSLNHVFEQFLVNSEIASIVVLNSGHINDTYLVSTKLDQQFILQRINTAVFYNVEALITNKILVSKHLIAYNEKTHYQSVEFIKAHSGHYFVKDKDDNYWNLMPYIQDSKVHQIAVNTKMVYEAGKLYGNFIASTSSLKPKVLAEIIPNFHNVPYRIQQFYKAIKVAASTKLHCAKDLVAVVNKNSSEMRKLSQLKAEGLIPIRTTHNDTKLSNILFTNENLGLAVIDLDTVMPGIVHYDFGDSVRSICSSHQEDATDIDKVHLNLDYYKSFCKGYANFTKNLLTETEILYLPLAIKTLIYIMGLRFLTDYLNGDTYYKISYPEHNLTRARNQFKLFEDVASKFDIIKDITHSTFK